MSKRTNDQILVAVRIINLDTDPDTDTIRIRVMTLIRYALAEVCTVPVLVVYIENAVKL